MKLSIAVLAASASATNWLKRETEVQDAYFAGDDIVLSNPAARSNKQWHDCGEAPPLPLNARAVECSGSHCAAVCPIGWRSQGRWRIKCKADNTWAHSKFSPCVTCPDMSRQLKGIVEAENGAVYQEIFSEEQNLPITQFFCGKTSDALFIKNKMFTKGGKKRNVMCKCQKGRNGDPAWKKSCAWEFQGNPWSPSDVESVQCKTKDKYCELASDKIYFNTEYKYRVIDDNAQFKDYFRIIADDFTNDIHLGFSNGFTGHDDEKWEIVLGGWSGSTHVIRDANQTPIYGLVASYEGNRSQFIQLRKDFIVQVTDGNIGIYFSESGSKGDLVLELNDERIKKSELNTLVASGGYGGSGHMQFNGVGCI